MLVVTLRVVAADLANRPPISSASEYEYPPFAIVTTQGEADGFSVRLLRSVLKAMGRDVTFEVAPHNTIKKELASGRIQVLPRVARSATRGHDYDFSVPYLTMHGTIIVRKGDDRIRQPSDLPQMQIAVMEGDIAEEYLREHALTNRIVTTRTIESALRQLANGRHDAVVAQKLMAETLIKDLDLDNLESVGHPLDDYQQFCFAVRHGDGRLLATLNEGLSIVVADGTFERLREEWLTPVKPPHPLPLLPIAAAALVALVFAWAVAFVWQRSLRRKVASRTAELSVLNLQLAREIQEHRNTEQVLRRTSEELEAIFHNVHSQVAVLDREFRFLRVNKAYAMGARRPAAAFIGVNHFELYPHAENEQIFRSVVNSGRTFSVDAKPFEFPDQPERGITYWDWTLTPIKDSMGEVEALLISLVDVTEREERRRAIHEANRRAQAELESRVRERTSELEAANYELQSFSYSVSHDLRGPLRAINGFSHALEEDCGDNLGQEGKEYLSRIREATVRMGNLIDGLLKLSQVFRSELQFTLVNLSTIGREIAGLLQDTDPQRSVDITIQPGLTAIGDATLLRVVLDNLLSNAWKFTSQCDHPVIIFGREMIDNRETFFVRDNGIGFDMAYASKLFRPFERLHVREGFSGTGIGLATVQRVIRRHWGIVWAEGRPGDGATFFFALHTESASDGTHGDRSAA